MKHLTKEYKIDCDFFNIKIGTINRDNPFSFYVVSKGWIIPRIDDDYCEIFDEVKNKFNELVKRIIKNNNLSNKFISSFDINYESICKNRSNFISLEIVFRQKDYTICNFKEIKENIEDDIKNSFISLKKLLNDYNIELKNKR